MWGEFHHSWSISSALGVIRWLKGESVLFPGCQVYQELTGLLVSCSHYLNLIILKLLSYGANQPALVMWSCIINAASKTRYPTERGLVCSKVAKIGPFRVTSCDDGIDGVARLIAFLLEWKRGRRLFIDTSMWRSDSIHTWVY